jgi:ubiquinone biosynthesis protein COQ4
MSNISKADYEYFNGAAQEIATDSSVLVSSSAYLNHPGLRALVAQEMLRKNGADLPNTAYIPEVAAILHQLEDMPRIGRLFAEEAIRLPEFGAWLKARHLSNFKIDEVQGFAPGTLGATVHDFLANSGYNMDYFFQGMEIRTDVEYYLKERVYTHDIEHMVTGFETNHCGEVALLAANFRAFYAYFRPELAAYCMRIPAYLKAKTLLKNSLHYPEVMAEYLNAEDIGAAQGRAWKKPLLLVPWRQHLDWRISDIREEYGISNAPPSGHWAWTTAASEGRASITEH